MMPPIRPMLGELELAQVQSLHVDEQQLFARHDVPSLDGDFLQELGRRGARIRVNGVLSGPLAAEGLTALREHFRDANPVSFASDISSATQLDEVIIERMDVTELAGKPERLEYSFVLRAFTEPPDVDIEPPPEPPVEPPVVQQTGTLVVTVIVDGDPSFDFSRVIVTASGTTSDGNDFNQVLNDRQQNVWTEENFTAGVYTVEAVVSDSVQMRGTAAAEVRAGETEEVTIILRPGAAIAKTFLIHFRFDNSFVEPCMRMVLRQVAEFARNNPNDKLVVLGNTDLTGSTEYNQSLSERRARSAFAYLRFGVNVADSLAEWNELRRTRPTGTVVTLRDSWGVREYQQILIELGYYKGNINGTHDAATDAAVSQFQFDRGLVVDGSVGDQTWAALIEAYLAQDSLAIPDASFFPNCPGEILEWIGCSELDPVKDTPDAWRPNRRTEFIFINDTQLPRDVKEPDTLNTPTAGNTWCLNPGSTSTRCCFVKPHLPPGKESCPPGPPDPWSRQPAEPTPGFFVRGTISFEDGSPFAGEQYILIANDGEFMDKEQPRSSGAIRAGTGLPGTTDANGAFEYTKQEQQKTPGIFTLEVPGPFLVRLAGSPPQSAKGNVACARLDGSNSFDVIVSPAPIDPSLTGPFDVGEQDFPAVGEAPRTLAIPTISETIYEVSAAEFPTPPTAPISTPGFTVPIRGLVRYPGITAGIDADVSPAQSTYPLVILAHGNHREDYPDGTPVDNFTGLEYLARHLASHGYIAVSVDLDNMNRPVSRFPAILQRGHVILDHIALFSDLNASGSGSLFSGRIDLDNIILIGHSRGGEAVVAAETINQDESRGANVKGVFSISATDFLGLRLTGVPYSVIYGSIDEDVSVGWPFQIYDRASQLKNMVFVYGAMHNRFSAHPDWNGIVDPRVTIVYTPQEEDSDDPRAISPDDHLNIAKAYALAFAETQARGSFAFCSFLKGYARPNTVPTVEIHQQFRTPGGLIIDDYEQGLLNRGAALPPQLVPRAENNTQGESVSVTDLVTPDGFDDPRTEASLQHRDLEFSWHDTVGGMVAWEVTTGAYESALNALNASSFNFLSLRVAQRFGSIRNPDPDPGGPGPGHDKDFFIGLRDTSNESALVSVSSITDVPFPHKRLDDPDVTKSALKTISIPLQTLVGVNSRLKLDSLAALRIEFRGSPTGELAIDEIEFVT